MMTHGYLSMTAPLVEGVVYKKIFIDNMSILTYIYIGREK